MEEREEDAHFTRKWIGLDDEMLEAPDCRDELTAELFQSGPPLNTFERLRCSMPVFQSTLPDGTRAWNLVRYDDVLRVLTSSREYGVPPSLIHIDAEADLEPQAKPWRLQAAMAMNPPDHSFHKQKLAPTMKPDLIEAFRPHVRRVAEQFTQGILQKGRADAIEDFAAPVATAIACEYLGIHKANREYARRLSADFMGDSLPPQELGDYRHLKLGPRALNAIHGSPMRAATELIYESWGHAPWLNPVFVEQAGCWEIEELTLQTLTAGIAGLRNCIATAVLCLAPKWQSARKARELWLDRISLVADEVLRHATPLLRVRRVLTVDATWHGMEMFNGDTLLVWLVGANFDPERFRYPRTFEPFRTPNPHLSFSGGVHRCLGSPVARMEIEEVIRAILQTWAALELRGAPVRFQSNVVTEFVKLPIYVG
jgi:cholest-4-en-3-one 26-monooxygenase